MEIKEILKYNDPYIFNKIKNIISQNREYISNKKTEKLSRKEIEELMSNRCYKRGPNRAIRQVRQ